MLVDTSYRKMPSSNINNPRYRHIWSQSYKKKLSLEKDQNNYYLRAGVNFINVLLADFARVDPKSAKRLMT